MSDHVPAGDELEVGNRGPELVVESVTRRDLVRYAGASGDFNPIHYHEEAAREAGHDGVIAQGMFTAGLVESVVTDWVGVGNVRSFTVRFTSVVRPGDTVRVVGEVDEKATGTDHVTVTLSVRATTGDGETAVEGEAVARLPR